MDRIVDVGREARALKAENSEMRDLLIECAVRFDRPGVNRELASRVRDFLRRTG